MVSGMSVKFYHSTHVESLGRGNQNQMYWIGKSVGYGGKHSENYPNALEIREDKSFA